MSEQGPSIEINCPACGREALLMRTPQYEGFTRVGETLSCALCGHVFSDEAEIPFKHRREVKVFNADDAPKKVKVFAAHEADRLCRHCVHYVVNPFMQWCGLHRKEVEATDTCRRFERKAVEEGGEVGSE